jgi:hypothetical protein
VGDEPSLPAAEISAPVAEPAPTTAASAGSPAASILEERPEVAIAGAFVGGLVLALILKRLAR